MTQDVARNAVSFAREVRLNLSLSFVDSFCWSFIFLLRARTYLLINDQTCHPDSCKYYRANVYNDPLCLPGQTIIFTLYVYQQFFAPELRRVRHFLSREVIIKVIILFPLRAIEAEGKGEGEGRITGGLKDYI